MAAALYKSHSLASSLEARAGHIPEATEGTPALKATGTSQEASE